MTFITGPSLSAKSAPMITGKSNEHVIQMRVVNRPTTVYRVPARALGTPLFIFAVITLIMLTCLGVMLAMLPNLTLTTTTRYQGFCTIPIKVVWKSPIPNPAMATRKKLSPEKLKQLHDFDPQDIPEDPSYYDQPSYKVMPLRWTSNPDVQVFSTAGEDATDDVINGLREQFDIGDTVEKISVMDNGRHVNFIHDFEANVTGIVDSDRCFTMELDPEMVMSPEVLVLSIVEDAKFDISRVRSTLRAALPALQQLAAAARELQLKCEDKPTYRLLKEDGLIIRKRALDAPSHDYIQFSGRRVQEIEISNLADLLQHEQDNKLA